MKRKGIPWLIILTVTLMLLHWLGLGSYSSGSAVSDLKAELEAIYGPEYTGKPVENGSQDMEFVVTPKTWFLTNWNLRNTLGLAYEYECQVVFTVHTQDGGEHIRTIVYQAYDPMGEADMTRRAYLDLDSRTESTER